MTLPRRFILLLTVVTVAGLVIWYGADRRERRREARWQRVLRDMEVRREPTSEPSVFLLMGPPAPVLVRPATFIRNAILSADHVEIKRNDVRPFSAVDAPRAVVGEGALFSTRLRYDPHPGAIDDEYSIALIIQLPEVVGEPGTLYHFPDEARGVADMGGALRAMVHGGSVEVISADASTVRLSITAYVVLAELADPPSASHTKLIGEITFNRRHGKP